MRVDIKLGQMLTDPETGQLSSIKNLAKKYRLSESTIYKRSKNNTPLNAPLGSTGKNSDAMRSVWVKRKKEMADVIANMEKRK